MADPVRTFEWCVRVGTTGTTEQSVLSAQFGDGYVQRSAVGINNEKTGWPVSITARGAVIRAVRDFLRDHKGSKSFLWTPPLDDPGLYCATDGYQVTAMGGDMYTLSTTFTQSFRP